MKLVGGLFAAMDAANIDPDHPLKDYETVVTELKHYRAGLADKPQLVVLNKMDLPDVRDKWPELENKLRKLASREVELQNHRQHLEELVEERTVDLKKINIELQQEIDTYLQLSLVEGVARVEIWGAQPKVIYLEASETQLSQIGISDKSIIATVQQQNMVVDAGSVDVQQKRVRIAPTGEFNTPEDIADLQIHPSLIDSLQTIERGQPLQTSDELIRIRDIGTVSRGYAEPPPTMMRLDGKPALTIYMTNIAGANIVDVGHNVDARMAELEEDLPIGLELHHVHWMSDVVSDSVNGFFLLIKRLLSHKKALFLI